MTPAQKIIEGAKDLYEVLDTPEIRRYVLNALAHRRSVGDKLAARAQQDVEDGAVGAKSRVDRRTGKVTWGTRAMGGEKDGPGHKPIEHGEKKIPVVYHRTSKDAHKGYDSNDDYEVVGDKDNPRYRLKPVVQRGAATYPTKVDPSVTLKDGETLAQYFARLKKHATGKGPEGEAGAERTRTVGWKTGGALPLIRKKLDIEAAGDKEHFDDRKNTEKKDKIDADYRQSRGLPHDDDNFDADDEVETYRGQLRNRERKEFNRATGKVKGRGKKGKDYTQNAGARKIELVPNEYGVLEPVKGAFSQTIPSAKDKKPSPVSQKPSSKEPRTNATDGDTATKRKNLQDELNRLWDKAESEGRDLTPAEDARSAEIEKQLRALMESTTDTSYWKARDALNTKLNHPKIQNLVKDLQDALRKYPASDAKVLDKALPSKFGGDVAGASLPNMKNEESTVNDILVTMQKDPNKDKQRPTIKSLPLTTTK